MEIFPAIILLIGLSLWIIVLLGVAWACSTSQTYTNENDIIGRMQVSSGHSDRETCFNKGMLISKDSGE